MPLFRIFGFALSIAMLTTLFSSTCSAQRTLRWLGHGFSSGYHQCNPGPNSDYYNPYSAHNSMLISQNPGNTMQLPFRQIGPSQKGVPFSVYAAPSAVASDNDAKPKLDPEADNDNSYYPADGGKPKQKKDLIKKPTQPDPFDSGNDDAASAPQSKDPIESANSPEELSPQPADSIVIEDMEDALELVDPFAADKK